MEPTYGGVPEQRASGRSMVLENGVAASTYFSWQRKVFPALKEVREITFAEVSFMNHPQFCEHIVAAMEVSDVRS